MTEFAKHSGEGLAAQIAAERAIFDDLYRNAFAVRERLGLERGHHVFNLDDPSYGQIELAANAYDDMNVTLHTVPVEMGTGVRGLPYSLKRYWYVSRKADGSLSYGASDSAVYASRYREEDDSELDTDDQTHDFSEPLPPEITNLLVLLNNMLPNLTIEQHDDEESEEYFNEDRYDRAKQMELTELEEALSTAGGAMYLLQLAALEQHSSRVGSGMLQAKDNLMIPRKYTQGYEVSAEFDPRNDEENWHPHIIEARGKSIGGPFRTYAGKFEHITSYMFCEGIDGSIDYEVADSLERGEESVLVEVDRVATHFDPTDILPPDVQNLVKHLLEVIVSADNT